MDLKEKYNLRSKMSIVEHNESVIDELEDFLKQKKD